MAPPRDVDCLQDILGELLEYKRQSRDLKNRKAGAKLSKMLDPLIE